MGNGSSARERAIDFADDPVYAGRKQRGSARGIVVPWIRPDDAPQRMRWVMSPCRPRIIIAPVLLGSRRQAADVDPFRPKRAEQGRFKHPGVIGAERRAFMSSIDSAGAFVLWSAPIPGAICSSEADAQCFEALQRTRNTPSI